MRRLIPLIPAALVAIVVVWHAPSADASAPACEGDVVVEIGAQLRAHPGLASASVSIPVPVAPGAYHVIAVSSDQRDHAGDRIQDSERWTVTFHSPSDATITLGPTSDLDDGVDAPWLSEDLGRIELPEPATSLTVRHTLASGGGQSVTAECVGLVAVDAPDAGDPPDPGVDAPEEPDADPEVPKSDPDADPGGPDSGGDPSGDDPGADSDPDDDGDGGPEPGSGADPGSGGSDSADESPAPSGDRASGVVLTTRVAVDCRTGEVMVTLANDGTQAALVDIAVPRTAVTPGVAIGAGQTTTTSVPLSPEVENDELGIRVVDTRSGGELSTAVTVVDCRDDAEPGARMILDCTADRALVELVNTGDEPTTVALLVERESADRIVLAGRASQSIELVLGGRERSVVVLDEAGGRLLDRRIECPRADIDAAVAVDCATGMVVVEFVNHGGRDGSATVLFADRLLEQRVRAGKTAILTSPLDALTGDRRVSVTFAGRVLHSAPVEERCIEPAATLDATCQVIELTLVNRGAGTADFRIQVLVADVVALDRRLVVPTGSAEIALPPGAASDWTVRVSEASRPEETVGEFDVGLDCPAIRDREADPIGSNAGRAVGSDRETVVLGLGALLLLYAGLALWWRGA